MTHVEDHKYNFEFKSFLEEYHSKDPIYSPLGIDLKYKDKEIGSITILKKGNEAKLKMVKETFP
jgi:hypothetical protein